jgi:hypothetical protein
MGNTINVDYDNVDNGIKSQIMDKFKKKYLDNFEENHLRYGYGITSDNRKVHILTDSNRIMFNNIQNLIEFVSELNRPFIFDDDNNKIRFVYCQVQSGGKPAKNITYNKND